MLIKSCPALVKAITDEDTAGTFEAIVSVFGNKDSYGDVVIPGAFLDSLAEWAAKGDPIPVYWSHRMDDPDYNIGHVLEAMETEQGLWVKVQMDLESPKAAQTYRLLKGRRVTQFSFAYDVLDSAWAKSEELGEYLELRKLHVYEVGPTPIGANQSTELLAVKHAAVVGEHMLAGLKAGRVISAKNEGELRTAHDALGRVLSVLDSDDTEKASGPDRSKAAPSAAVAPARTPSVDSLAELDALDLALSI